jgi:hypothetical protein
LKWASLQALASDTRDDNDTHTVRIHDEPRRRSGGLRRDPPAAISLGAGPDVLHQYTVDALKKFAKSSGVELPKAASREALVQALWQGLLCQGAKASLVDSL